MKKMIALFLVMLLFIQFNCTSLIHNLKFPDSIAACYVEYIDGSIDFPLKKRSSLVLMEGRILFKFRSKSVDIPYKNIISIQYSNRPERIFPKAPEFSYRYYRKVKLDLSFWEALLLTVATIGIAVAAYLLIESTKEYVYLNIDFLDNSSTEWVIYKIQKSEFERIYPILQKNTDIG